MKQAQTWAIVGAWALWLGCGCGTNDPPMGGGSDAAAGSDGGGMSRDLSVNGDGPTLGGNGPCGYQNLGTALHVAENLDVCVPPTVCAPETCPPSLGTCVNGTCVFKGDYRGVGTLPQAWATHYCTLSTGSCHGITQIDFPEVTAQQIATQLGHTVCDTQKGDRCIGIVATSPMLGGNSQIAVDPVTQKPVKPWGLGLTEASGLCYQVTGPGGTAIVAVTDRCGGYCRCNGSAFQECGACVNAPDLESNCPCVGNAGATACCGRGCATTNAQCDWCASNNHPHFDLDDSTFDWVCGAQANLGSCQLTAVSFLPCLAPKAWPPQ